MINDTGIGTFLRQQASAPLRLALEARAGLELAALVAAQPLLALAPRGDGHPVLVLPRFLGCDLSTAPLRDTLTRLGYRALPWGQGFNVGPGPGVFEACRARLADIHRQYGARVSLIGWSLGGLYARLLAKEQPERVRCVIGLGTPLRGTPAPAELWRWQAMITGESMDLPVGREPIDAPPPVPTTAIYTRSDGIVPWRDSLELTAPQTENIEIEASHLGLAVNPLCHYAIADRLAQPEGLWRPFTRTGVKAMLYPDPHRQGWF